MNLYDLNSDNTTMNIDGKDIEMKPAICFGKVYNKWLVSKCGNVWSIKLNRIMRGGPDKYGYIKDSILIDEPDWWGDGSSRIHTPGRQTSKTRWVRDIRRHKIIIDTWAPLYDNPPVGIVWEEWEIVRDLPSVYEYFIKSGSVDHIDDNKTNNHVDNLRRVTDWDNQVDRKSRGI